MQMQMRFSAGSQFLSCPLANHVQLSESVSLTYRHARVDKADKPRPGCSFLQLLPHQSLLRLLTLLLCVLLSRPCTVTQSLLLTSSKRGLHPAALNANLLANSTIMLTQLSSNQINSSASLWRLRSCPYLSSSPARASGTFRPRQRLQARPVVSQLASLFDFARCDCVISPKPCLARPSHFLQLPSRRFNTGQSFRNFLQPASQNSRVGLKSEACLVSR